MNFQYLTNENHLTLWPHCYFATLGSYQQTAYTATLPQR